MTRTPPFKRRPRHADDALSPDRVNISSPQILTVFKRFEFELLHHLWGHLFSICHHSTLCLRRTGIPPAVCRTRSPCQALPLEALALALSVKLSRRRCYPSPAERSTRNCKPSDTVDPTLSNEGMPTHDHHLHFAVHHGPPISVLFLDRRQRRETPGDGGNDDRSKRGDAWVRILPQPSESFRQICTFFLVSPVVRRLSCYACSCSGLFNRSFSSSNQYSERVSHNPIASIRPKPRYWDKQDMHCGMMEGPYASLTLWLCGRNVRNPGCSITAQVAAQP